MHCYWPSSLHLPTPINHSLHCFILPSTNTSEPPKDTFNFPDLLLTCLQFHRIAAEWLQRAEGEGTATEFTCSYVEVICSSDSSIPPLLVFIELGCIDKTEGKLLSTNEYSVLGKKIHLQWPQHSLPSLSPVPSQLKDNHSNDCVICNLRSV